MPEEIMEAKEQEPVQLTKDEQMDKILDGISSPARSSGAEEQVGEQTDPAEPVGADHAKKSGEEGEGSDIPKEFHKHEAWQRLKTERDDARKQLEEFSSVKEKLDEFKKVTSSREYIEQSMRVQGYTQEAIEKELVNRGFELAPKAQDELNLVYKALDIKDPSKVDETVQGDLSVIAKVARAIAEDIISQRLPKELGPLQDHYETMRRAQSGEKLAQQMQSVIAQEGVLDFEADVKPEINKFIDENNAKGITQSDVWDFFKDLNHRLSLERVRTGKKTTERREKKAGLRQNTSGAVTTPSLVPRREDYASKDDFSDAILDRIGVPF